MTSSALSTETRPGIDIHKVVVPQKGRMVASSAPGALDRPAPPRPPIPRPREANVEPPDLELPAMSLPDTSHMPEPGGMAIHGGGARPKAENVFGRSLTGASSLPAHLLHDRVDFGQHAGQPGLSKLTLAPHGNLSSSLPATTMSPTIFALLATDAFSFGSTGTRVGSTSANRAIGKNTRSARTQSDRPHMLPLEEKGALEEKSEEVDKLTEDLQFGMVLQDDDDGKPKETKPPAQFDGEDLQFDLGLE